MKSTTAINLIKKLFGSAIGLVFSMIVGFVLVGLTIRLALSFPGDSFFPLLIVGIVLALIFAASIFNSIRDK